MTIYLIGGPPKCGKTTLAKELSKKLSIPRISADTLQNIVHTYMEAKNHEKYFPHSHLRKDNNDTFYKEFSANTIVERYIIQGKSSYKAISMVVETQIIDKDDYIIEGYQITPEIADKTSKKFGNENIKKIFLVKHDENKFIEDLHKSTTPNDWIIRKTKEKKTFLKIAKMISTYSKYFEEEVNKYDFTILNMDHNFKNKIKKAIRLLTK